MKYWAFPLPLCQAPSGQAATNAKFSPTPRAAGVQELADGFGPVPRGET